MHTVFASVKNRNASSPPSRPKPEFFIPPKGVLKSLTIQQLIHTTPDSILLATRSAFFKSVVQIEADNPYSVAFAISTDASSLEKGIKVTTGPKISS